MDVLDRHMGEMYSLVRAVEGPLEFISGAIDLIGISIILWGFSRAFICLLQTEFVRIRTGGSEHGLRLVRQRLGAYILIGIEFMIASDIINTVVKRELEGLAFVSALVAIRTAISYFLGKELAELDKEAVA